MSKKSENELNLEQIERSPINNSISRQRASEHSIQQFELLDTPARLSSHERLDGQILRWLLHYPLQRIEDIALGVRAIEQTTRRHVQALAKAGLIEQVMFARSCWFYLTDQGIHTTATDEGLDPRDAARAWQANERSLLHLFPRFPMLLSAQNFINDLVQGAPTSLAFQGRSAAIRWRWVREYDMTCSSTKHRIVHCTADAAIVLRRRASGELQALYPLDEYYVLLLYFDLGETCGWSRAMIATQLRNLLLYRESQERLAYRPMFPLVVVLVGGEQQGERWQQAAHEAAKSLRLGTPLAGIIANIAAQQQIVSKRQQDRFSIPHSYWHYDWRDLQTNQHCRLQERLRPMTLAAVPAGLFGPEREQPMQPAEQKEQALPTLDQSREKANVRHVPVVRGKFHERLPSLSAWPVSPAKEREMVSLLGLVMSQRLCDLVQMVFAHPLTTSEELGWFLDLSSSSVERYLWTLGQWHCVETVKRRNKDDNEETRWKLSARGLHYLAASRRLPLAQVRSDMEDGTIWQPGVFSLQKHLRHTAGVYWLLMIIIQSLQARPPHQMVWFASHLQSARRYSSGGSWHNFRPDATVLYQWNTGELRRRWLLWIEWDQGTMGVEQLRKKMASYAHYIHSRSWRSWGQSSGEPVLVIVVPDRGQADRMIHLAREFLQETDLQVSVTL